MIITWERWNRRKRRYHFLGHTYAYEFEKKRDLGTCPCVALEGLCRFIDTREIHDQILAIWMGFAEYQDND